MAEGEDVALLARAQAGDLAAFEQFVRLFERRVRGLLGRILHDDRDVEEAAQDTFVQAWRHLDRFRGDAAAFTWLYRIAVNEALQRTRRKRLETQPLDDNKLSGLDYRNAPGAPRPLPPDLAAENREVQEFLAARLHRLPLGLRIPLVLRDLEDWSNQEIADALELSLPAAKSRIHRARMQIRYELETWLHERERT
jgi:RNA polymerase sigma-70 factor, ECF subfamily